MEEMSVWMFDAYQIVPAIRCGAENDPITCSPQTRNRLDQQGGRQSGAVSIDETNTFVAAGDQVLCSIRQAVGQPCASGWQHADLAGDEVTEQRLGSRGRI